MSNPNESADRRGKLDGEVFAYRATKRGEVFISWRGRQVTALRENKAVAFLEAIAGADGKEAQLLMAKATGHFKHGNERAGKK